MLVSHSRHAQVVVVLFVLVLFFSALQFRPALRSQFQYYTSMVQRTADSQALCSPSASFDPSTPFLRRHVAIATSVGHSEVYGPLAWTVRNVMTKHQPQLQPTSVKIYAGEPGFLTLLKRIGMLPKDIMRPKDQLSRDIQSTVLYEDDLGAMIDLVVLGTCELDLERFGPDLLKAWDERSHDKKFMLVCGVHNGQTTGWFKHISEWSRREDARAWGYRWSFEARKYIADATAPNPPFVLHLLGKGKMTVPAELQHVVVMDIALDTVPFYELFQSMDIVVPAFSEGGGYLTRQASSTVHTAVMNNVPLLATRAILESYPYLTSEGTILRPFAFSEMEAIGLFRGAKVTAQAAGIAGLTDLSAPEVSSQLADDVKRMLSQGWKRSDSGFDTLKQNIWKKNEDFVGRLLRDL
ncbi:hypothetical protein FRC00_007752 [Tulasnella sp. 408]|nr:hypothetical protein FRC00_007752 [Tulasnella sp. 408]